MNNPIHQRDIREKQTILIDSTADKIVYLFPVNSSCPYSKRYPQTVYKRFSGTLVSQKVYSNKFCNNGDKFERNYSCRVVFCER